MAEFSHIDPDGNAVMVEISAKSETERIAVAKGSVFMEATTIQKILDGGFAKGDVLSIGQLAGIMGAKRTPELIPLCHPLLLTSVKVELTCDLERNAVDIVGTCKLVGKTGVEMEALTSVSIAALAVYDMCKSVDKAMSISDIRLIYKAGGKSGEYVGQ
ncbi:MAG: cyclic pyranopterin monophosphate synthase MoaC [Magnetovibrio sp.]|nr:cyclic pyranopterin monophosphate synthase MoaC [Magnetovibrio sp.]|tara:strand:+ start:365 stop:841 length:477 start_codon:yes stop_codon:yes gene_type:complete